MYIKTKGSERKQSALTLPSIVSMKKEPKSDEQLSGLLRSARPEPTLAPGFARSVWRRIEREEAGGAVVSLNRLVERLLTPRLAFAGLAVLLIVGGLAGALHSAADVRHAAQARYVASISPTQ